MTTLAAPQAPPRTEDLPVAVRGLALPPLESPRRNARRPQPAAERWPPDVLVFDTETTLDPSQRLLFGFYRLGRWMRDAHGAWRLAIVEEGVIYGDDLEARDPEGYAEVRLYSDRHQADVEPGEPRELYVYSRAEFAEQIPIRVGYQARALLVGFNLPFDLSRVAARASATRPRGRHSKMAGGWSLELVTRPDGSSHPYRPRITIKHIDPKRALIEFASCLDPSRGRPQPGRRWGRVFRGHFLDLRTLVFALTDAGHSLRSAGKLFEARVIKPDTPALGDVTPVTLAYGRQDVAATAALLERVREEFDKHPIETPPWAIRSPASIAKGYFRAMGITPPLTRIRGVTKRHLGAGMAAYYGGRTEVRIRKEVVPVVVLDATSMYPTVNILATMQEYLVAEHLTSEPCIVAARAALDGLTVERCLDPSWWPDLRFFAEISPDGDLLPVRSPYAGQAHGRTIGLNPLTSHLGHWYTGFDLAAAMLLGKRAPTIRRAFRILPHGTLPGLRAVQLRGEVAIDPRRDDIFQRAVEARHEVKQDPRWPAPQLKALDRGLKVFANSGAYGAFAEMTPRTLPKGKTERVHVEWGGPAFESTTSQPEEPGEYFFPPTAALITGAARLLLALVQRLVEDDGGTYLAMDTDSIFIVATARGGLVPCVGGPHHLPSGKAAIRALSWARVDDMLTRLDPLKPYGPIVRGSLFKIEDENFAPRKPTVRRQLYGLALAAKRYCLFNRAPDGAIVIRKASEHGLGALLDPTNPKHTTAEKNTGAEDVNDPNAGWIPAVWRRFVRQTEGKSPSSPPQWWRRPAVTRFSASSPTLLRPFAPTQRLLSYPEQLKPFSFLLAARVRPRGHPGGMDPQRCCLVAPFETDPRRWFSALWMDLYSRTSCYITTAPSAGPALAAVMTVGDVIGEYWAHPEAKSLGPDGKPGAGTTRGVLQRRPVTACRVDVIGKETNRLSDVEEGTVATWEEVQTVYARPKAGAWDTAVLPRLTALRSESAVQLVARQTGVSRRTIWRLKSGSAPGRVTRRKLLRWADALHMTPHLAKPVARRKDQTRHRTRNKAARR